MKDIELLGKKICFPCLVIYWHKQHNSLLIINK